MSDLDSLAQRIAELERENRALASDNKGLRKQLLQRDPTTHYQALILAMQEGVILQDRYGQILEANPSAARILGIPLTELSGKYLERWQIIQENGEPLPKAKLPVQRALREARPNSNTVLGMSRPNTATLWLLVNAQPLFYPDQTMPYAAFASFIDITQRKQTETKLRQSEERFELAIQGANDGVWDINFITGEAYFSPRWKQMLGFQVDELPNNFETWQNRIHPDDYDDVIQKRLDYLQRKTHSYEFVFRLRHRQGHYLPILTRGMAVWDDNGQPKRMIGTHTDLSNLHAMQEQLSQVQNRIAARDQQLSAILTMSPDSIVVIDPEGTIELVNPATEQLFGYETADLIGRNVSMLMEQADAKHHDQYIQNYLTSGLRKMSNRSRELSARRCDGSRIPILLSISEFKINGQQFFAAIIHDISIQKQVENELNKARELAEDANQSKSTFLATMSHEIRTPLNGILGMAELLSEMTLTDLQQRYVNNIKISGQSLLAIIGDILDFSRLESNSLQFNFVKFKFIDLINNSIELFQPLLKEKGLYLKTYLEPELASIVVESDPQRLQQILNNLLNNALKFTSHGHIELNAYVQTLDNNQLSILFEVIDSGIGIEEKMQKKLFQPFTQLDYGNTRRYGGSGLGLIICKRLVEIFQGKMGLDSHLNQGSRFWFSVPMRRCENNSATKNYLQIHKQTLRLGLAKKVTILVVEDNIINQVFIQESLQRLGAKVAVVENGALAVHEVKQQYYDVIFMDCHMPEMDGFTAVQHIRQWEQRQKQPQKTIIALTANAMPGERERCLKCGMNDYLTKPVARELLLYTLQKWLPSWMFTEDLAEDVVATEVSVSHIDSKSVPPQHNEKLLDYSILNQLRLEIGVNTVNRLIDLYLNELPNYFNQLSESLTQMDAEALYLAAHKFKGASKNLGVSCFIWYCEQLELLAHEADLNTAQTMFEQLCGSVEQVRAVLIAEKNVQP